MSEHTGGAQGGQDGAGKSQGDDIGDRFKDYERWFAR